MTGIWAACVAIARPYAPRIFGRARHDARVSGTADQMSESGRGARSARWAWRRP